MKCDGEEPKKRHGRFLTAVAGVLAATAFLLTCSSCKGFFVDPTLSSIQVTPAAATVLIGATQQYQAVSTFSDGSTKSISPVWSISPAGTATISTGGLVKGVAAGTATITATSGTLTGTTTVTVQKSALQSISVTPALPTISRGGTLAFTATGTFADTSTQVLTNAVWSSSTATIATVDNNGVATALTTAGSTVITATVTPTSGTVVAGSTTLTVK